MVSMIRSHYPGILEESTSNKNKHNKFISYLNFVTCYSNLTIKYFAFDNIDGFLYEYTMAHQFV